MSPTAIRRSTRLPSSRVPARAIAEWVREKDIDILVDVNGFSGVEQTEIFRLRPAPLQVNYLGYYDEGGDGLRRIHRW